jgi:hypothetical protein
MVKVQKASIRRVVVGWRPFTPMNIADRYNSMLKDLTYSEKFAYALEVARSKKGATCAP